MSLILANRYIARTLLTKIEQFGFEIGDCSEVPTLRTDEYKGSMEISIIIPATDKAEPMARLQLSVDDDWVDTHPDMWQTILNAAFSVDPITDTEVVLTVALHQVARVMELYVS